MPTYRPEDHGARLSWELLEGINVLPLGRAFLSMFEFSHPDRPVRRYVVDNQDWLATLESTAPMNPGEEVLFEMLPISVNKPDQSSDSASPTITMAVDNVAGIMANEADLTRGSMKPWRVTERLYASDDLSGPVVLPPTTMLMSSLQLQETMASISAAYGDPANRGVPATHFNRFEHPGLTR